MSRSDSIKEGPLRVRMATFVSYLLYLYILYEYIKLHMQFLFQYL